MSQLNSNNIIDQIFQEHFQIDPFVCQELSQSEHTICKVIKSKDKQYFAKCFISAHYHEMMRAERTALLYLAKLEGVNIPRLIDSFENGQVGILLFEYIHACVPRPKDFENLGNMLKRVHEVHDDAFGWPSNNFIGVLGQANTRRTEWSEFLIEERIYPQIDRGIKAGYLEEKEIPMSLLRSCSVDLFNDIKPCLLHGDFWNGNFLIDQQGTPYLIDPSIYFGDPLVDIAMSQLFGGFDDIFYSTYLDNKHFNSIELKRIDWYQLYYLLVHLNIFGVIYKPQVLNKLSLILKE